MKRLVVSVGAGLVLCALACSVWADGLPGVYTYKLVLRDDLGFALNGAETTDGDGRVSSNYKIEVFSAAGDKIGAELRDWSLVDDRNTGCNCTLSVPVGEGVGYAKTGLKGLLHNFYWGATGSDLIATGTPSKARQN